MKTAKEIAAEYLKEFDRYYLPEQIDELTKEIELYTQKQVKLCTLPRVSGSLTKPKEMKADDEILREFDEAIQYFINYPENLPGTEFCNNVDKLINIKCDIMNKSSQELTEGKPIYENLSIINSCLISMVDQIDTLERAGNRMYCEKAKGDPEKPTSEFHNIENSETLVGQLTQITNYSRIVMEKLVEQVEKFDKLL